MGLYQSESKKAVEDTAAEAEKSDEGESEGNVE